MRRRDFIAGLAPIAAAWPLAARGQQPMPVVGFLSGARSESLMPSAPLGAALRDGLTELDFLEGKNFVFESRWANGEFERLPSLALDLIGRSPAVIVTNTLPAASAAKAALEAGPDVMGRGLEASTLFRKVRP